MRKNKRNQPKLGNIWDGLKLRHQISKLLTKLYFEYKALLKKIEEYWKDRDSQK